MSSEIEPEVQVALDTYVELWHSLNDGDLTYAEAAGLSREYVAVSHEIRRLTGLRPGDFQQVMARIGN